MIAGKVSLNPPLRPLISYSSNQIGNTCLKTWIVTVVIPNKLAKIDAVEIFPVEMGRQYSELFSLHVQTRTYARTEFISTMHLKNIFFHNSANRMSTSHECGNWGWGGGASGLVVNSSRPPLRLDCVPKSLAGPPNRRICSSMVRLLAPDPPTMVLCIQSPKA